MTKLYWIRLLASFGALPFLACTAAIVFFDNPTIGPFGTAQNLLLSYSLLIVSFMAGILWGVYLIRSNAISLNLLLISNVLAVAAWAAFILLPARLVLLCHAVLFLCLLYVDRIAVKAGVLTEAYLKVRYGVTGVVVVSLLIAALQL